MNKTISAGDKVLMVCDLSVSIEEVVSITNQQFNTRLVDVNVPDMEGHDLREWILSQPKARLKQSRLEWFASPATINLSNHGEHVVVGVYYRP